MNQWIQESYARLLIDNHITEDDPTFMTRFDPAVYVAMVRRAGVDSSMVYACDHNGNCYYPTQAGHMHRNLNGRDIFGETVSLLRKEGVHPVAYYTTIYHNHSAKNHPAWRMQDPAGRQHYGRYWWSCPNNPEFVEFTRRQIGEVITYDVDGIFVDMTFWPCVCCCANCRAKFREQAGLEIPETVDWSNPHWNAFQQFRERSMAAFTEDLNRFIKGKKDITVTFQSSPIIYGWAMGQSNGIADSSDYVSGDFYGGKYQHLLGAKILAAASKNQPFEYMTSRCVNLSDHTSMKSEAELACEAATTLANGGAYFFIDAINPDGTLVQAVYDRLGSVSSRLAPFVEKLREHQPALFADKGLYFSMPSHIDTAMNGKPLREIGEAFTYSSTPTYEEMLGASIVLTRMHAPYRVLRDGLGDLSGVKALVLNNILRMAKEEVDRVREFVRGGGALIATGLTSLYKPTGVTGGDFALADVLGVSYAGGASRRVHYLSFMDGRPMVSCSRTAPLVMPAGADVLAQIAEPIFDPDAPQYASIHSNPPGRTTEYVGLSVHAFGKGQAVYLSSPLLTQQLDAQQSFGEWLFNTYAPSSLLLSTDAPPAVEITLLQSTRRSAALVGFVNWQKELPGVPVHEVSVKLRLPGGQPRSLQRVSDGSAQQFTYQDGALSFTLPLLETIEMVEVEY